MSNFKPGPPDPVREICPMTHDVVAYARDF